jgi:tetratricopeptide (TPR) repeat protein
MKDLSAMLDQMDGTDNVEEFPRLREVLEPEILRSHDPVLLWRLGQIYRHRKIWQDAERILQEAIKWGPSMPEPFRDMGLLYLNRDDIPWAEGLTRAREVLESGVRVERVSNDPSAITHTLLGRIFEWLDQPSDAEAELRKALEIDPHYEEAQYNLAMLLDESRRDEKLSLLRQSIVEDPHYFVALRDLGFEFVKAKQLTEAESYLNMALTLDPKDVSLHWYLGQLKWMQKDVASAELHFRKAVELDPGNSESHRLLGRFYQYHDRPEEANRELFSAIELEPGDGESFSTYLKFLGEFEDPDFARKLFRTAQQNSTLPQSLLRELESKLFGRADPPLFAQPEL